MSAWYIFSTIGFYPDAPGSPDYQIGSPAVNAATIHLENGKTFSIVAKNQSDKNVYVQKIELNGKPLNRLFITHSEIMNGGKLVFFMTDKHR
jgi:putative alpha-1,2-mannosidase